MRLSIGSYVCRVHPLGDSITDGVGSTTQGAWRESCYNALASTPYIRFVGTQTDNPGGLTANPDHEGIPGATVKSPGIIDRLLHIASFAPDIVILQGMINDILAGDSASTVLATLSTQLDTAWGYRQSPWMQIIQLYGLRTKESHDPTVQLVNAGIAAMVATKSYSANVIIGDGWYNALADSDYASGDNIHPGDPGYIKLGAVAAGLIKTARINVNMLRGSL